MPSTMNHIINLSGCMSNNLKMIRYSDKIIKACGKSVFRSNLV